MDKIEVIYGNTVDEVEVDTNEFLRENEDIKIKDIKLSSCSDDDYNFIYVLIHYKVK